MRVFMTILFSLAISCTGRVLGAQVTSSIEVEKKPQNWQALVDDSTCAIALVDVAALKHLELDQFTGLQSPEPDAVFVRLYQCLRMAQAAEAERAQIIVSLADRLEEMPLLVLEFDGPLPDAGKLQQSFPAGMLNERQVLKHPDHDLLLVGSKTMLERATNIQPQFPDAFKEAFATVPSQSLQIAIRINDDTRLVVRQMFDSVPDPVVDGFQWAYIGMEHREGGKINIKIQQSNNAQAELVLEKLTSPPKQETPQDESFDDNKAAPIEAVFASLGKLLNWEVEDSTVVAQANQTTEMTTAIRDRFTNDVYKSIAIDHLKQIELACHNYNDVHNVFPEAFPSDENKTKLGWRVAILPYIERNDLYKRFHHDEPWDSEHNLSLVDQMPDFYYLPGSRWKRSDGMTCVQAPAGENRLFYEPGITFGKIRDGSSNTIALIESNDDNAQIWTRPDGIKIPLDDPLSVLGGHYHDEIVFARADGSCEAMSRDADLRIWKALFTPNGSEPIWTYK